MLTVYINSISLIAKTKHDMKVAYFLTEIHLLGPEFLVKCH